MPELQSAFTKADAIESLDLEQLTVLSTTHLDVLMSYLRRSAFDAERLRMLLELGVAEAQRQLVEQQASQVPRPLRG